MMKKKRKIFGDRRKNDDEIKKFNDFPIQTQIKEMAELENEYYKIFLNTNLVFKKFYILYLFYINFLLYFLENLSAIGA